MTKQRKGEHFKRQISDVVWCRNNIFKVTAETDEHFLPHQRSIRLLWGSYHKGLYESERAGVKNGERLALKCLENLQMVSCSVKETEKPVCLN